MISALFAILLSGILPFADTQANRVWLESAVSTGEYRNVFDASTQLDNRIGAQGATRNGSVSAYGRFEYGYDWGQGATWRGWMDPYSTPFMVCDSIPGSISKESYDMEAAVLFHTGRWRLGADCRYRTSLMAKHRDLRNKNTRMDFSIAPCAAYDGERFHFTATAGYTRNTEQVEYMQVDESTEKYLFQTYGLWFHTGSGFSSAETRRFLSGQGTFADLTVSYKGDDFSATHDMALRRGLSTQTETGYNNLHHGDTRTMVYEDALLLKYRRHSLSLSGSIEQMAGYRTIQRQELDPASKVRRWFSYGDPSQTYWREVLQLKGSYSYEAERWSLTAGASYLDASHSYKEYPVVYTQTLSYAEPWLAFSWTFSPAPAWSFRISPSAAYKNRLGGEKLSEHSYGNVTLEDDVRQIQAPFDAEYAYWSANVVKCSLRAESSYVIKGGRQLSAAIGYSMRRAMEAGTSRSVVTLSLGYNF